MANPEIELRALRETSKRQILEAIQQHRGVQRHAWHEQSLFIRSLEDVEGGWKIAFSFIEDADNCSQYDKSISWEGEAFFKGTEDGTVSMTGRCWVTEAGVASDFREGTELILAG